ncbi:hypothetical protein D3C73_1186130 [compost metagenome]
MDRDLLDSWVGQDRALHLETGDVLPSPTQIVLLAIDKVEKSVLIELADIPGVEPHVPHDLQSVFRPTPVSLENDVWHQWPTHDFASDANRHLIILIVEDTNIKLRGGLAR